MGIQLRSGGVSCCAGQIVISDRPLCLDAEDSVEINVLGLCVEVVPFVRFSGKLPAPGGKVVNEESVCFFDGTNSLKSHLLEQSVLTVSNSCSILPFAQRLLA